MKEKETSKANITRRRQEIREELSAPPQRCVDEIRLSRRRQTIDLDDDEEDDDPRVGLLDPFLIQRREKQPSISAAFKNLKICKEKIGRATSRWLFFNSIPANAVKGSYYESMIETIGEVGKGVEGPTPYAIYNKYLDLEVEYMKTPMESRVGVGWSDPAPRPDYAIHGTICPDMLPHG
ncbi:hypothetical protein Taro_032557 [Colocasia esculenta]|uniref:Uncharacterized protein n=1 Tax=Colocasia esculenta TaxID=4460 RepID=A0A843VSY8_COLES|nr:hypothetical protein [Colocasia esculenta]